MTLEVKSIDKIYKRKGKKFTVLEKVSFNVESGEFVILSGVSGSGKSTLLAVLGGFLQQNSGDVIYDGLNISNLKDEDISKLHNSKIGYVPQNNTMLSKLNIINNVILSYKFSKNKNKNSEKEALELLKEFGVEEYAYHYPYELSGGQLRRVALARALIKKPEILIADEPTSGLDRQTSLNIMEYLRKYANNGNLVIIATHDSELYSFGDINIALEDGKVI